MSVVTIRGLSREWRRALKRRAVRNRRSAEAEIKAILEEAVLPGSRLQIGSELAALGRSFDGVDLDLSRDDAVPRSAAFG